MHALTNQTPSIKTADVKKITGQNILRVWRQVEQVARRLQAQRGPSTAFFKANQ